VVGWYERNILEEERLLAAALARRGLTSRRLDWARADVDWTRVGAAVFRTTWDYFLRPAEFAAWLDRAARATRLVNCAALVRWNLDKRYLADLAARGVRVVPGRVVERGDRRPLAEHLAAEGWADAVLKPVVSGAGRETYRVAPGGAAALEPTFRRLVAAEAMLLQPFQRAVVEEGERSLVVIGGRVTHAVLKVARPGEFRVHDDHGGTVHPHAPGAAEVAFAEAAVAACDPRPRYARVDLVRADDGEPALMELELIEPELFFRFHPPAADALAAEIADELGQPAPSAAGAPAAPLALRPRQPRRAASPNASRASSNRV
jgi:glutathione synthase/RimK-type ligase-like ATP-grasp enzyme